MTSVAIRLGVAAIIATGCSGTVGAAEAKVEPMVFACDVSLMVSPQQLSSASPVTIGFTVHDKTLREVHVVDVGGILFPGGNMKLVKTPEAMSLQAVPFPPERPGVWTGQIQKKMYRLTLAANGNAAAATIGLAMKPAGNGRIGLVWNASHLPEGMPKPLSGSGVGSCVIAQIKDGIR